MDSDVFFGRLRRQLLAQRGIGRHSAADENGFRFIFFAGQKTFLDQDIDDALLKRVGHFGVGKIAIFRVVAMVIQHRCLDPAETKI